MNRITFDKPKSIDLVKEEYDITKVSVLTTPNLFPLIKGIEFDGSASFILAKKQPFPVKRKMDAHIEAYQNAMLREWKTVKGKLKSLINRVKQVSKVDYNNKLTVFRIAKIPTKYKLQFIAVADKYDLNLAILDAIVLNPSLMVNARYDNEHNLLELNPDYLAQHGMIRIGDVEISETEKTFIHEFAHAFWYNSLAEEERMRWSSLATFLERDQLTGDMSQYLVGEKKRFDGSTTYSEYYTVRDEPFVSVYARFNTREDFAECFLYYKVSPKTLEQINPNKYAFIQDKVGNTIEKENLTKAFEPDIEDPKKLRDKIIAYLDSLKNDLSEVAKDAIITAFLLGKQKAAHYTGEPYNPKLTTAEEEEVQRLLTQNDEFLDDFMDTLSEEHDNVLFTLTPTGFVEGVKEYDDIDTFDQEFDGVMDNQEYRLGSYATNGVENAMAIGMIGSLLGAFAGGYWHTEQDDKVCDECGPLDGQWMSLDEFSALCVDIDGIHPNCRCKRLFEPALAPGDEFERIVASGTLEKRKKKICAVDYHNTIQYLYQIDNSVNIRIKEKLEQLKKQKYQIVIHFGGVRHSGKALGRIIAWLKQNEIPYDEIWMRNDKPKADLYFENVMTRPSEFEGVEKGGPGSGRYPAGSSTKLSYQEQQDYDKLSESSKMDYMDHRRAGTDHQASLALAEPDKAYVKKSDKTVAVDYHGTIMINNKVNETIKAKLQEMRNEGYHIIVYTSGTTNSPGAYNGIQTWLKQNEIPFDEVWQKQGKPDADLYFEDKAVRPSEIEGKTLKEIEAIPDIEDKLMEG